MGSGLVLLQTCCVLLGWLSNLSVFSSCFKLRALSFIHSINPMIVSLMLRAVLDTREVAEGTTVQAGHKLSPLP